MTRDRREKRQGFRTKSKKKKKKNWLWIQSRIQSQMILLYLPLFLSTDIILSKSMSRFLVRLCPLFASTVYNHAETYHVNPTALQPTRTPHTTHIIHHYFVHHCIQQLLNLSAACTPFFKWDNNGMAANIQSSAEVSLLFTLNRTSIQCHCHPSATCTICNLKHQELMVQCQVYAPFIVNFTLTPYFHCSRLQKEVRHIYKTSTDL